MPALTRILLIDDDQVDRASVRRALVKSDLVHELVEAPGGVEGLHLARGAPFDCVLLDYRLPGVDTFELLETLVSPEGGLHAVVMLTGEQDGETAVRLMRAGALDYLSKAEATPSSLARAIRYARARRGFVAELDTARRDAEEKSAALATLNQQKTLLLSIIAHDLRNPFQALLSLSTSLSRAVANRDHGAVEVRAKGIVESAGQAHRLMEGLFAWAHAQMDTLEVTLDAVALDGVAQETLDGVAEMAAAKGIALGAACGGLVVQAQRDMLATVLRNLVTNAIKFTAPGGQVTVAAVAQGGRVELCVADTGVGMDGETLGRLFQPDRRVTTDGTAGERGSGLGLLLCHDLVARQGSALTVTSVPGEGTVFRFTLDRAGDEAGDGAGCLDADADAGTVGKHPISKG